MKDNSIINSEVKKIAWYKSDGKTALSDLDNESNTLTYKGDHCPVEVRVIDNFFEDTRAMFVNKIGTLVHELLDLHKSLDKLKHCPEKATEAKKLILEARNMIVNLSELGVSDVRIPYNQADSKAGETDSLSELINFLYFLSIEQ